MESKPHIGRVYLKDVVPGALPLTVAFAEEVRVSEGRFERTAYSTYTTMSGVVPSLDDGAIKDED